MVKQRLVFLCWWLVFTLVSVAALMAYSLGLIDKVYQHDSTMICAAIAGIFAMMTLHCGYNSWRLGSRSFLTAQEQKDFERAEDSGWFSSQIVMGLGFAGTLIGFIMMLSAFAKVDVSNIKTVQDLLTYLSAGMSVAIYTTLVGLIASMLLQLQYFFFNHGIDRIKAKSE